jgi:pyruvate dehydrogenase E1 component
MSDDIEAQVPGWDPEEMVEWQESLDSVVTDGGPLKAAEILSRLQSHAQRTGIEIPFTANTPYVNTIPVEQQPPYPGNLAIERRVKSLIRWNAMAMVLYANKREPGIGGHISTFASAATLYEVGYNHFFRARTEDFEGDIVYIQGHAAPGVYARAFLLGRLTVREMENFRRELQEGGGLSSYPHPWLMPDFWEFPTVSMGLGPIMAIYQARFNRYLENRGLKPRTDAKVWAFLGDGETDEPEALGAITLAAREKLDNLIFVINCNLQRLDGPVRGNGQIIPELEAAFRGAGWNVIKVIWGSDWDPLFARDPEGLLATRMGEIVDGEYQRFISESGSYFREKFFGADRRLLELVRDFSDDDLKKLRLGGHDPRKVYAAYKAACEEDGKPTVILARTIKGYGLGESGEGKNITHQQKKLNEEELRRFRERFAVPIRDEDIQKSPFYRPPDDSPDIHYLREHRMALGGYVPKRMVRAGALNTSFDGTFDEFYAGTGGREVSTTMAVVRMLARLLKHKEVGKLVVPIVPDEARTFGMESLFREVGIYASQGQLYEPVDSKVLLYYKEAKNGQILEEGITEAGSLSSFIAAGTAYSTHGLNMIPFFIFYSMFGLQRVGDLIWAAADMRCRGFVLGGTAGRTTLAGEGLQHQDGNSHVLALPVPNLRAYDPAFAYELAVIIEDGIQRMYRDGESIFYYITVMNEQYAMPAMPPGDRIREGILRGMYLYQASPSDDKTKLRAQLFGSGAILREAIQAQAILAEQYRVAADVWSVTSYKELYRDAIETERWNMLHPLETPRLPYISKMLKDAPGVLVAASDYLKTLPAMVSQWMPRRLACLGTDGFGRSEGRQDLRNFFEVDARHIVFATLGQLFREQLIGADVIEKAKKDLGIQPEKLNPHIS